MFKYRAYCENCDHTEKESSKRTFLRHFFLGDRCNNCGEYKKEYGEPCWKISFGRWVPEKRDFYWFKPSTWKTNWIWEEKE